MYEVDIMVRRGTDEPKRQFPTIQGERMRTEVIQEFLVFARHLNFSKAAAELHITQPNLSKHMMELEREIGVELIDRKTYGKNRPVLSEAGKYFFEEMSYIETSIQGTVKRCRALGSSGIRDVRVQEIWQNNAMFKLYSLAGTYQSTHLESTIRYVRLSDKQPIEALLRNDFDMVFDVWCGPYEQRCEQLVAQGVTAIALQTEQPYIWYQEGNRYLEGKGDIYLKDLLDIPVVMTRGDTFDYMVVSYAAFCERAGLTPRLRHLKPHDNSPTGMFMSDFRDGVLMTSPAMTQDPRLMSRPDLKYREVADERVAVTFLLAVRTDDRGSMEFLDYVDKHK